MSLSFSPLQFLFLFRHLFDAKLSLFSRYDNISGNLEKSDRERLFDEHIDMLVAKKKENYRKLLDECKSITLDSSFKDIKKLIKDDPRYSRYVCT